MAQISTAVQWLIAGGRVARLGDMSRARHGRWSLDAPPECRRQVLAVVGQPLEGGLSMLTRTNTPVTREYGWTAFRRTHDVRLRERYHGLLRLDGKGYADMAPWPC
jgi:hypothetical protein